MEWSQFATVNVSILARRVFTKSFTFGQRNQPRLASAMTDRLYPRGGGKSHIKRTGLLDGNFGRAPKRYQDPALWAWLENVFTPKRYQF